VANNGPEKQFSEMFSCGGPVHACFLEKDASTQGVGLPGGTERAQNPSHFFSQIAEFLQTPKNLQQFEVKGAAGATPGFQPFNEYDEVAVKGANAAPGPTKQAARQQELGAYDRNRAQLGVMAARCAP
jgi:hypothetical protein